MKVLVILKTHTCNEFLEPHGRQDMPCFVYEHSNTFARISPLHFLKAATARLREDLPWPYQHEFELYLDISIRRRDVSVSTFYVDERHKVYYLNMQNAQSTYIVFLTIFADEDVDVHVLVCMDIAFARKFWSQAVVKASTTVELLRSLARSVISAQGWLLIVEKTLTLAPERHKSQQFLVKGARWAAGRQIWGPALRDIFQISSFQSLDAFEGLLHFRTSRKLGIRLCTIRRLQISRVGSRAACQRIFHFNMSPGSNSSLPSLFQLLSYCHWLKSCRFAWKTSGSRKLTMWRWLCRTCDALFFLSCEGTSIT